ncbi:hypothetical protein [Streptomyces sp. NPDC059850]|uniref:hypothetical protein n=1 Tax=Streptomyces sp. NPDC059850 TaxID=3346970 RepID=UPI00364A6279
MADAVHRPPRPATGSPDRATGHPYRVARTGSADAPPDSGPGLPHLRGRPAWKARVKNP